MGKRSAPQRRQGLYGLRGPRDNPDPHLARRLAERARVGARPAVRLAARRARAPRIVAGRVEVRGALDKQIIRRVIRRHVNEVRYCYERELQADPQLQGRVVIHFTIANTGQVMSSAVRSSTLDNRDVERCIAQAARRWLFPMPRGGGIVVVSYPFLLRRVAGRGRDKRLVARVAIPPARGASRGRTAPAAAATGPQAPTKPRAPTEVERFDKLRLALRQGRAEEALYRALRWRARRPGSILALVALGEALTARGNRTLAARVYGSIIDLYPSRADMRRFAGARLEALGARSVSLAADSYAKAIEQRPDHVTGYRLLAYAQLRGGRADRAFTTLSGALKRRYPDGRFVGYQQVLREDLALVAAAWLGGASGARRARIQARVAWAGVRAATRPSLRFVLNWETDANDVDLHVHDGRGGHAFYSRPRLDSGGTLYADVTTGYGPECFTVPGKARAYPYRLKVNYYARGPMGYGMGKVQVIHHDGMGGLRIEDRPFVVTRDQQFVDLGLVRGPG